MLRLVSPIVALALASTAAPAVAQAPRADALSGRQVVMVCTVDAATRRAYHRQFGAQPVFVTARQTLAARSARETWSTPRCMTQREYGRLIQAARTGLT